MFQVNNAAFQMMQQDITDIPNEQWIKTFDTNIHPFSLCQNFWFLT